MNRGQSIVARGSYSLIMGDISRHLLTWHDHNWKYRFINNNINNSIQFEAVAMRDFERLKSGGNAVQGTCNNSYNV